MARARLARATSSWSAPDSKPDPSGFCTLTRSVYKWAQLHTTLFADELVVLCVALELGARI